MVLCTCPPRPPAARLAVARVTRCICAMAAVVLAAVYRRGTELFGLLEVSLECCPSATALNPNNTFSAVSILTKTSRTSQRLIQIRPHRDHTQACRPFLSPGLSRGSPAGQYRNGAVRGLLVAVPVKTGSTVLLPLRIRCHW